MVTLAVMMIIANTHFIVMTKWCLKSNKLPNLFTLPAIQSNYTWLLLSVTTSICTLGP